MSKTVFEMAKEAEFTDRDLAFMQDNFLRLVELVRADAIADEREACAKVCDDWPNGRDDVYSIGVAIRARENT